MRGLVFVVTLVGAVPFSPGSALSQVRSADDLCPPRTDPCIVSRAFSVAPEAVLDFGSRELRVASQGHLQGSGASFTVLARSLRVDTGGTLSSRGNSAADGGSIELEAAESVLVAGEIDVSGASGGNLRVDATRIELAGGRIRARALAPEGSGGSVLLEATELELAGEIVATGASGGSGGQVEVAGTSAVTVRGSVDVSGGELDAGDISIESGGTFTSTPTASFVLGATNGGSGGFFDLDATGLLLLGGSISASGGSSPDFGGDGGQVDVTGSSACVFSARITALAGGPDGSGGSVLLRCEGSDPTVSSGDVDVRGTASESGGGQVILVTDGGLFVTGRIDASGREGGGGTVDLQSPGEIRVEGSILANGTGGPAGTVGVDTLGVGRFELAGTLAADSTSDGGGRVEIVACRTFVERGGRATALGPGGALRFTAANFLEVSGTLRASSDGGITFVYRDNAPAILATATVDPAPVIFRDSTLAGCGGGPTPTPSRTRTPSPTRTVTSTPTGTTTGNTPTPTSSRPVPTRTPTRTGTPTPTPTRTPTPRPTPAGPGDVDCNGRIDLSPTGELLALAREIFLPPELGCPLADVNGDGNVGAADYPALFRVLPPWSRRATGS